MPLALTVAIVLIGSSVLRLSGQDLPINRPATSDAPPSISSPAPTTTGGAAGLNALRYAECEFCHKQYLVTTTGRFVDHNWVTIEISKHETFVTCVVTLTNIIRRFGSGKIVVTP